MLGDEGYGQKKTQSKVRQVGTAGWGVVRVTLLRKRGLSKDLKEVGS